MKSQHCDNCPYSDSDALLYAALQITDKKRILISAREVSEFDDYLECAKKNDKDIFIDMDESDNKPYCLVYGGLMFYEKKYSKVCQEVEQIKGYALLDIDREDAKRLSASLYSDIVLYPELSKSDGFVPFAALMQTTHPFDNEDVSVTMFPGNGNLKTVWEQIVNRPFLLACRKKIELPDGTNTENWKKCISEEEMMKAYSRADLYTGSREEDEL